MQIPSYSGSTVSNFQRISAIGLALFAGTITGCQATNSPAKTASAKQGKVPQPAAKAGDSKPSAEDAAAEELAVKSREHTERISSALAKGDAMPPKYEPTDVQWIEPAASRRTTPRPVATAKPKPAEPVVIAPVAITPAQPVVAAANNTTATVVPPAADDKKAEPEKLDRQALLAKLLEDIRTGEDPAMNKAMSAAALALLDPTRKINPTDVASLTKAQQDTVKRYQDAVAAVAQQIAAGKSSSDTNDIAEQLRSILGEQPIRMRTVQLCKKVTGYGVYDTFEKNDFLAGREQPLIVYAELENFQSTKDATGQHQVRLSQEIVLYNESDGLAVWRQPKTEIVDQSRNRRRDFFVVQLIRLPARISVGKYRLKVRTNDLNGSSIDEASIPVQFVADQAMVSK